MRPSGVEASVPTLVHEIPSLNIRRLPSGDSEFDRVVGGGIVPGALILTGGDPGIGKSTLMLQIVLSTDLKTLYASAEESLQQIKIRAERLGLDNHKAYILAETHLEKILEAAEALKPDLMIIDSIQTIYTSSSDSPPGSLSQVRDCAHLLQRKAKDTQLPIIIIGHITKEGSLAGPKVLEHMVDAVLQFEGDRNHVFRLLRVHKNRFGSTDELGIYEMQSSGLVPVADPSSWLLNPKSLHSSGIAVGAAIEGQRPLLIETQALVSQAVFGTPQRSTTGFDLRRLHMLLAVLEKRCGLFYGQNDVYLNLAGGLRVTDPALDLAIVAALISSLENRPIPKLTCLAGEIGLAGEIRSINQPEGRIAEAERQGFRAIFLSSFQAKSIDWVSHKIEVKTIADVGQLYDELFREH